MQMRLRTAAFGSEERVAWKIEVWDDWWDWLVASHPPPSLPPRRGEG